jgi:hypothetical protein
MRLDSFLKEVGFWAFQFHCAGCYNWLLTGSILIPLVQTYCTSFTELNPGTKNVPAQILKGFCRDCILGRKVTLVKQFEIWTICNSYMMTRELLHTRRRSLRVCNNETIFCIHYRAVNHVTDLSHDLTHPLIKRNGLQHVFSFLSAMWPSKKKFPMHSVIDTSARWTQQLEKFTNTVSKSDFPRVWW